MKERQQRLQKQSPGAFCEKMFLKVSKNSQTFSKTTIVESCFNKAAG